MGFLAYGYIAVFDGDFEVWQGFGGWSGEYASILGVEVAFVARTDYLLFLFVVMHRAHQVSAALAVRDVFVFFEANQNTGFVNRVVEEFMTSDFDFTHLGNRLFEAGFLCAKKSVLDGIATSGGYDRKS